MGFHLYFYLILVDYLILFGVGIVSEAKISKKVPEDGC